MPLGLHAECKARLIEALSAAIPYFEVKNGMFLERFPTWMALYKVENVLPSREKIREQLVNFIDERPFTEFVMDTLSFELNEEKYVANAVAAQKGGFISSRKVPNR